MEHAKPPQSIVTILILVAIIAVVSPLTFIGTRYVIAMGLQAWLNRLSGGGSGPYVNPWHVAVLVLAVLALVGLSTIVDHQPWADRPLFPKASPRATEWLKVIVPLGISIIVVGAVHWFIWS